MNMRPHVLALALLAALSACADRGADDAATPDTAAGSGTAAAPTDAAGTTPPADAAAPGAATADAGAQADAAAAELTEEAFVAQALAGGAAEVHAARLALEESKHAGIREFAQKLERDHTEANRKMAEASGKPAMPEPDAGHRKAMDALRGLSGAGFDRAWLAQMDQDHARTIALFENATRSPQVSARSKALAQATLPALRDHAHTVQRLRSELDRQ